MQYGVHTLPWLTLNFRTYQLSLESMRKNHLIIIAVGILLGQSSHAWAACTMTVSKAWKNAGLTIDASTVGQDCARAAALLLVRDGKGHIKYSFSSAAEYIGTFGNLADAPVTDNKKMLKALNEWVEAGLSSKINRLSHYTEWKAGADGPIENPPSEFPFTVNSDVDRNTYEDWRKQNLPVFCFVQGIESERCIVVTKQGEVSEVGIQSFPG